MKITVATGIVADQITPAGNLYPRDVLEKAIRKFNIGARNSPVKGGILDRNHIQRINGVTHYTQSLFLNDSGVLCAIIEIVSHALIEQLGPEPKLIARPLLSIPSYIVNAKTTPININMINNIIRVQLELDDGPKGS